MKSQKDFRLLFIQANSPLDTLIPPNLATLSAFIKKEGFQVKLFDTTFYKWREKTGDDARVETLQVKETNFNELGIHWNKTDMVEDFKKMVDSYKPHLIGLSAVSLTFPIGLKLLKSIQGSGIPTIVGGIHATVCPLSVIKEDAVDFVCVGEGEGALIDLCYALYNNENYSKIKNLWVKYHGKIIRNSLRPLINLDDVPFQDWEIFDKRRRYKPMGGKIRVTACVELNRGCPFSCTYCTNEFWHKMYGAKHYRERSIDKFIAEVKYLKERYNIEYLYISAETFLATSKRRFNEFIEKYREIQLPFWLETRPETVTDEKIRLLKEVGCESMNIGIESGDPELRDKLLNRKMSDDIIINAVHTIKKHNIRVGVNNIIGFPTETREQIFKTIELNRKANPDNVMVHPFNPYHGTRLYDVCVAKGYISKGTLGGDYRTDYFLKQPQLSRDDVMGLYRTFAMYVKFPKSMWSEIKKAESFDDEGNTVFNKLSEMYKEKYLAKVIR